VDVQLDLKRADSPQMQVFGRFVRHFERDRRELAYGTGDGWLSPADQAKLDEVWEQIWDDGLLDDYTGDDEDFAHVQEQRAFCATGEGGGVDNSCGAGPKGTAEGSSEFTIDKTPSAEAISLLLKSSPPSAVARRLGFTKFDVDGSLDRDAVAAAGRSAASFAAQQLSTLAAAAAVVPGLKNTAINVEKASDYTKILLDDGGYSGAERIIKAASMYGMLANASLKTGEITLLQDRGKYGGFIQRLVDSSQASNWFSTNDPRHLVVHEYAHTLQKLAVRKYVDSVAEAEGRPRYFGPRPSQEELDESPNPISEISIWREHADATLAEMRSSDREFSTAATAVSKYGQANAMELAAEYWTAVTLGSRDNDEKLDQFLDRIFMPRPVKKEVA